MKKNKMTLHEITGKEEPRTDMTDLEEMLFNIARQEHKQKYGITPTDFQTTCIVKQVYLPLLQKCDEQKITGTQITGYDLTQLKTPQERSSAYQIFKPLIAKGLVTENEYHVERTERQTVYRGASTDTKPVPITTGCTKREIIPCYTLTQLGREKLQDHRVVKNAHS